MAHHDQSQRSGNTTKPRCLLHTCVCVCKSSWWLKPFEGCRFLRISLDAIYLFQDLASSGWWQIASRDHKLMAYQRCFASVIRVWFPMKGGREPHHPRSLLRCWLFPWTLRHREHKSKLHTSVQRQIKCQSTLPPKSVHETHTQNQLMWNHVKSEYANMFNLRQPYKGSTKCWWLLGIVRSHDVCMLSLSI